MSIFVDIEPRFDDDSIKRVVVEIHEAVSRGVQDALKEMLSGLAMTPDERQALEDYRSAKAVNAQRVRAQIARLEGN